LKTLLLTTSILFFGAGCATQPLSSEEKAVRILRKSDAAAACKEIGKVISSGYAAFTPDGREENLKRETNKVGGDTVTIDRTDENNTIFGTAFNCGV
jgi:hypothetical protein